MGERPGPREVLARFTGRMRRSESQAGTPERQTFENYTRDELIDYLAHQWQQQALAEYPDSDPEQCLANFQTGFRGYLADDCSRMRPEAMKEMLIDLCTGNKPMPDWYLTPDLRARKRAMHEVESIAREPDEFLQEESDAGLLRDLARKFALQECAEQGMATLEEKFKYHLAFLQKRKEEWKGTAEEWKADLIRRIKSNPRPQPRLAGELQRRRERVLSGQPI